MLTGGILGVGLALAVMGFPDLVPAPWLGQVLQVLVGILAGMRLDRGSIAMLPRYLLPAVCVAVAFVAAGVGSSFYLSASTSLDRQTALFASLPGGLTEIVAIGSSVGADGPTIAAMHLVRLLSVLLVLSVLLAIFRRKYHAGRVEGELQVEGILRERSPEETTDRRFVGGIWGRNDVFRYLLTIGSGTALGIVGLTSGFPAGGVVGAMVGSAAARISVVGPMPTHHYQLAVQVIAGLIIGFQVNDDFFGSLIEVGGAALIITAVHLAVWAAAFFLLWRYTAYGTYTSLFATAPGGMSELTSTAASVGADTVTVALTHMMRITFIVVLAPVLVMIATA